MLHQPEHSLSSPNRLDLDAMWSGNQSRSRAEPLLKIVVDRSLGHYMYPTELLLYRHVDLLFWFANGPKGSRTWKSAYVVRAQRRITTHQTTHADASSAANHTMSNLCLVGSVFGRYGLGGSDIHVRRYQDLDIKP